MAAFRGQRAELKKAIARPCCMMTALMPEPDASVSRVKDSLKLGKARTGAEMRACCKVLKAAS
jgi:hypothetical protein